MQYPEITINNYEQARQIQDHVQIGHYFVFYKNQILPFVNKPVPLAGIVITPKPRTIVPIGCVVTDRDLYRAGQDTAHLFIAFPTQPKALRLRIECNGDLLTERPLELIDGLGIETLFDLQPGRYSAQLSIAKQRIGTPVSFTVAEYHLAPLSARLVSHQLVRDSFSFELAVESYQMPFNNELTVTLVEQGRKIAQKQLFPQSAGCYVGELSMHGKGPFNLRLMATHDVERVTEVAIPGSRTVERQATVINKLGQEKRFSMMPAPHALPVRGGYLTDGDFLATPLSVEEVVTESRLIKANVDVNSLTVVNLDVITGQYAVQKVGNVKAGQTITVQTDSAFCTAFVGGFVNGQAFEGYTSFIKPTSFQLSVEVPKTVLPRTDLIIRLTSTKPVPVLLCVRDERLMAQDKPEVSLGAAAKRTIEAATGEWDEQTLIPISELITFPLQAEQSWYERNKLGEFVGWAVSLLVGRPKLAYSGADYGFSDTDSSSYKMDADFSSDSSEESGIDDEPRAEFPEVLFYEIVPVNGTKELVIALSDSLGTFTVDAFALSEGDWTQTQTTVVVDKPVRVDLELPPAIHPEDKVIGRLRAITGSGQARLSLTLNGQTVAQRESTKTPIELEFYVQPGTYLAEVEDTSTGETDSLKKPVSEMGKFKSYTKELCLLLKGDSIKKADVMKLRLFPALDTSFENLVTATADYTHLCCEQTAAKMLAATFMYLTAKSDKQRRSAEQIILAGVDREQKMIRPGQGFAMYPNDNYISEYYSKLAMRYLWKLEALNTCPDISKALRQAVHQGLGLAEQAAQAHKMQRIPKHIHSLEEAYSFVTVGKLTEARQFIENFIDLSCSRLKTTQHKVADRQMLAYAAASLIAMGDFRHGIKLANQVTRQFNEQGRLYSTVDSVAAIALMVELKKSKLITGTARVRVNGQEMTVNEVAQLNELIETIEVLEGVAAVEVTRCHEDDWNTVVYHFPIKIGFKDTNNKTISLATAGESLDLVVTLPEGYRAGDLVHIALPACLSWIQGGGKVKQVSLDFEGQDELRIPLIVTSKAEGKQHFAVCLRNMFEEERATSPGLLTITMA
jgi:hypothetical protein